MAVESKEREYDYVIDLGSLINFFFFFFESRRGCVVH